MRSATVAVWLTRQFDANDSRFLITAVARTRSSAAQRRAPRGRDTCFGDIAHPLNGGGMPRYSYSSATTGITQRMRELFHLATTLPRATRSTVDYSRRIFEETKSRVFETTGVHLEGKKGLDIGPGQQLGCLRRFSVNNEVTAIDTDVIPVGFDPLGYARMLCHNTPTRVLKTLARKAIGVDSRFSSALARDLGVKTLPRPHIMLMNANQMSFTDASFDFVYSHSVFEHIDDPEAALREVARVLRPGGVAYVSVHLYTSHSGQHDPKIFAQSEPEPPYWPHLRPAHAGSVHASTFLNRLSLREWQQLFQGRMPDARLIHVRQEELAEPLRVLRESGELSSYTDDELLTVDLVAVWQKPSTEVPLRKARAGGGAGVEHKTRKARAPYPAAAPWR
jgi:SAM-dependent methyltransferase